MCLPVSSSAAAHAACRGWHCGDHPLLCWILLSVSGVTLCCTAVLNLAPNVLHWRNAAGCMALSLAGNCREVHRPCLFLARSPGSARLAPAASTPAMGWRPRASPPSAMCRKQKVQFDPPAITLDLLIKYGKNLVDEQDNVRRVQLAEAYMSGAELAGTDGSSMPPEVRLPLSWGSAGLVLARDAGAHAPRCHCGAATGYSAPQHRGISFMPHQTVLRQPVVLRARGRCEQTWTPAYNRLDAGI